MKDSGGESGEKDGQRRNLLFRRSAFAQEEGKSDKENKQQGSEQGMKIGAVKREKGGRAEIRAQQIDVGDRSCDEHGNCGVARKAGKSGAFEGIGGQGVSERIHERVISQRAMRRQLAVMFCMKHVVKLAAGKSNELIPRIFPTLPCAFTFCDKAGIP